jgi:hypothetical protein
MKTIKDEDKDKEEGIEVKEPNPDILESAFESNDPVEPIEGVEEESPFLESEALEDEEEIDSGDFRVANDW